MQVKERFLQYVAFDTASDETSTTVPTTAKQRLLGEFLAAELTKMGLENAHLDEYGYVYGWLPATAGQENAPTVGLIAHMDTSPAVSGADIHPMSVIYGGGDIPLASGEAIREESFPALRRYMGQELIVTDGTTLLGADDKAGVAEIVTACEYLLAHPELPHGRVAVCITPDEEVGSGADHFDVAKFGAAWAYTVDGGELGEIEYENFNAASAVLTVHGLNIHPGAAKNRMKNAALIAAEFVSMLPAAETPAHTEGYEGFYHVTDIRGDESGATVGLIIRDHDRALFEQRKAFVARLGAYLDEKYGAGTCHVEVRDSYYNMKEMLLPHMHVVEAAQQAMTAAGVTPRISAIRGGTDGARLSYMGLPCPNLSTGGMNFHSIHECIPVPAMEKMVEVLIALITAPRKEN